MVALLATGAPGSAAAPEAGLTLGCWVVALEVWPTKKKITE